MSKSSLRKNLFLIQTQLKHRAGQRTDIWVIEVVEAFVWEGTGLKQRTKKLRLLQIQNMNTRLGSTQWKMNLLDVEMSILRWIVRRGLLTCAGSDRRSHFKGSVRSNTPLSLSLVLHTTTTAIYYFSPSIWCTLPSLVLHISTVQIYKTLSDVFVWTTLQ